MSDEIYNALAGGMNELNTALTDAFAPTGVKCFLLKRSQGSADFIVVAEIQNGFFSEWNDYREQTVFSFAGMADDFNNSAAQMTHIGYGVPDADNDIQVFAISEDQRDRISPDGTSPFWKFYGLRVKEERFTLPGRD